MPVVMSSLGDEGSVWGWLVQEEDLTLLDTQVHALTEEEHRVGRAESEVSIQLGEALCRALVELSEFGESPNELSRQHFLVRKAPGDELAELTDLSRNGTWVNGVKVGQDRRIILQHCSNISLLGPAHKVFQYLDRATMDSLYPSKITSKYLVSEELGRGTTAVVMKAFKNWNNNQKVESVALKMIQTKNWDSHYTKPKDMMREVDIQRDLNHPTLVLIEDVIRTPTRMVLVMEHLKGGDLFDQIMSGEDRARPRSELEVKVQFYQMAHCVRYLHSQNISHRDLKLENILVFSPSSSRVKITDFGLAKVYSSTNPLRTYAGTPAYMAPEVSMKKFHKVGSYNMKADCWSLGVILYQMLSGRFPFPDGSDQEQRILSGRYRPMIGYRWDRVKKEAKDLVSSLLEVDLERRISSDKILQHPWISRDELAVKVAKNTMFSDKN